MRIEKHRALSLGEVSRVKQMRVCIEDTLRQEAINAAMQEDAVFVREFGDELHGNHSRVAERPCLEKMIPLVRSAVLS